MRDCLGRTIDYLRVSLTSGCNMRCMYCCPSGTGSSVVMMPMAECLRLVPLIVSTGISRIRFTGGEPLLYPHLPELIARFKRLPGVRKTAVTTNGLLLAGQAEKLRCSGLDEVNISLDAVHDDVFFKMNKGRLKDVLAGIEAAKNMGFAVKLNSVILKDLNESEIVPLVQFAQERKIVLRFIELMPFGAAAHWQGASEAEIISALEKEYGQLRDLRAVDRKSPAHYCTAEGFDVPVGFISAVSHSFCAHCSRIRLTADGILRPCLLHSGGTDLKAMAEAGCSDEEIKEAVQRCIFNKPERHHMAEGRPDLKDCKSMAQIGG